MKEEVLRLSQVTCLDQGLAELNHFCLSVFSGEIMGLIPVNGTGTKALLRLLRQNLPIHYGYVYYREQLVNHWLHSDGSYNRVSIVEHRSGLAGDLTVADNVFVLRHGFGKRIIQRGLLGKQLTPFLKDIGVEISADAIIKDLAAFERFVVEIVKAVVAGNRLIVLLEAGAVVSDTELAKLHDILRHYATKGISFLYVSQHYEEIRHLCGRVALMANGQIVKILSTKDIAPEMIQGFGVESYEKLVRGQDGKRSPSPGGAPALEVRNLHHGAIAGLSLRVAQGECVVIQDLDNQLIDDFVGALTARKSNGSILVAGREIRPGTRRDVAIIQRLAAGSMLFPHLSYLDNLCFMIDHRLPRVWRSAKPKRSIRREYAQWLGPDVFDKSIDALTQAEKYDLCYARVLLQRPKVAVCVQPFMQADVERRMHIWRLLEKLLEKNIAVVILAVNLADTLSLADHLIQIRGGRVFTSVTRAEFKSLPESAPWRHLWASPGALASNASAPPGGLSHAGPDAGDSPEAKEKSSSP